MPSERVLVVGAGVAGSVLAFWLAKNDFDVVVVERARAEQRLGQGIEIEEPALKVVQAMGIMDELEKRRTGEAGFRLVNEKGKSWASFDAGGISPTGALEIMRGELAEILYKAADESDRVSYRFGTSIRSLKDTGDKVIVELEKRSSRTTTTEEFDLVVGADGARSRTRQLLFGAPENPNNFKNVGAYVAYFDIPKKERDWPNSSLCQFPGSRAVWLRPIGEKSDRTTVYLMHLNDNVPALREANAAGDRQAQKEAFAELFDGLGWETPRVIRHMMEADNFYSDELVQVKLPRWSKGRVALLGDACWAPTPFTGQGNQLALIGGWVLAQELARNRSAVAFYKYEQRLRGYVETSQNIPLWGWAPAMSIPQTGLGILGFRSTIWAISVVARFVTWTGVLKLLPEGEQKDEFDLEIRRGEKNPCC